MSVISNDSLLSQYGALIASNSPVIELTTESTQDEVQRLVGAYGASERDIEIGLAIQQAENPNNERCNLNGCKYGIGAFQIVQSTFDEQCFGSPYILEDNIKCGMQMIENDEIWRWRQSMYDMPNHQGWLSRLSTTTRTYVENLCQCVTYARNQGLDLPRVKKADDLVSNTYPFIGAGVLFDSNHIGVLRAFIEGGIRVESGNCDNRCRVCVKDYKWEDVRGFIK